MGLEDKLSAMPISAKQNRLSITGRAAAIAAMFLISSQLARAQDQALDDCEKAEIAADAVRACTALLGKPGLDAAQRGQVLVFRGNGWLKEEEPAAAIDDFAAAIEINPKNIEAITGRALAHAILGEHEQAAKDWDIAIASAPSEESGYYHRGVSYVAAGKANEAIADFNKVTEINPKNIEAFIGRAKAYDKLNDHEKALQELAAGIAIDKDYLPIHIARAEIADRWGETKLAVDSYLTALRLNGMNLKARQALQRLGVFTPPN